MNRIGMVVAMPEETEHILNRLGKIIRDEQIAGYAITSYSINDKTVFLINSGVGEITSAAATMLLINQYKVECVINFGISGSLNPDIEIGDLLIGASVVHYDFDVSAFLGIPRGRYLDMSTTEIPCNQEIATLADKAYGTPLRRVIIASGDKFIACKKTSKELVTIFGADICEMESAGIIRVARRANVPALFIKTISDKADENAENDMNNTIAKGITAYATLIENLLRII